MTRVAVCLRSLLVLVACGPSPSVTFATESSSGDTTSAGATATSTGSGSTVPTDGTSGISSDTTGTGGVIPCGDFMIPCGSGSICIEHFGGDYVGYDCVPNPDGCVPDYPCPPACQALCEQYFVGACPESNAGNPPHLLECPEQYDCDPFLEPVCPEGRKCSPSHICEPLAPTPAGVGEPCTPGTPDPCVAGAYCALPHLDGPGTCFPLCTGTEDTPACAPDRSCIKLLVDIYDVYLCLPTCDPLAPNCAEGDECVLNPLDASRFVCVLDASARGGALFTPCAYPNGCDPGLFCSDPAAASECNVNLTGCCLPFCDLTMPTCPGAGQECVPWFAMAEAPPGLEDVGRCALP